MAAIDDFDVIKISSVLGIRDLRMICQRLRQQAWNGRFAR
jgi:hypothetical protein